MRVHQYELVVLDNIDFCHTWVISGGICGNIKVLLQKKKGGLAMSL